MAEFSAGFRIYANASQFHREMKEAAAGAKAVQGGLRDIGINIRQFLGVGAVIGLFSKAANAAQEIRDHLEGAGRAVPPMIASAARYADQLDRLKSAASSGLASVLGFFTSAGEAYGSLINRIRGISAEEERANDKRERDAERLEKQRDDAYRNRASIEAKLASDREAAERKAQKAAEERYEAELRGLLEVAKNEEQRRDALAKLASFEREQRREKMTGEERIIDLRREEADITKEIADYEKIRASKAELTTEGAQKLQGLMEQQADLQKRIADEAERAAQAEERAAAAAERKRRIQADVDENRARGVSAGLTSGEQAQLEAWIRGGRVGPNPVMRSGGVFLTQSSLTQASDAALQEYRRQNENQLLGMTRSVGPFGDISTNIQIGQLQAAIAAIQRELDFRNNLRADVRVGGIEGARARFQGDPLEFDRIVQQFVQDGRDTRGVLIDVVNELRNITTGRRTLPVAVIGTPRVTVAGPGGG